jgi:hypothetical protein
MWKTRAGFWLPGSQPGWLFAWIVLVISRGESPSDHFGIALVTLGNTIFYSWLIRRLLAAEVASRGALGNRFLRRRHAPAPRI